MKRQRLFGPLFSVFVATLVSVLVQGMPTGLHTVPISSGAGLVADAPDSAAEQWQRLSRVGPMRLSPAAGGPILLGGAGAVTGTVWTPIGPDPISEQGCCGSTIVFKANGRVDSIAVDPTNSNVLYLGSAGGGVWRSDNAGSTWRPLTDRQSSLGIGSAHALAVDPNNPNTLYAGTSNFALLAQSQPRPIDYSQSKGILKSTDGGASWIVLGSGIPAGNDGNTLSLFSRTEITTIIVDPADRNRLYLSAGREGTGTGLGGLFRSTTGGSSWTSGTGGTGIAESLALDTSTPLSSRVLYAGVNGVGVLKSADGGQSWQSVLRSSTPAVVAVGAGSFGKVMVALAPTSTPVNPSGQVVYATLIVETFPGSRRFVGMIFQNTNGGTEASWTKKNAQVVGPTCCLPLEGFAFSDMVVDPSSPGDGVNDLIYWGGLTQYLSTDSGDTFAEIGQIHGTHGDHQTFLLVPRPGNTSIVYAGDDGGIWKSTDQGATWTGTSQPSSPPTINAGGLQVATLYGLAVKQDPSASVTLGGSQDSGVLRGTGGPVWTGTSNDAFDLVFDRITTGDAYSIQNGCGGDCIFKSTDSGSSWIDITPSNIPVSQRGQGGNRLAVDPNNAGYVYVGGSSGSVFLTTDGGANFHALGTPAPGKYLSSLDVAPANSNALAIAANDLPLDAGAVANKVFVTTNALAAAVIFVDITANLPSRFVTRVAFDPADSTVVYATLAGYGATTPVRPGHVFRTTIGSGSWTDVSPPVDIPVNALALDGTAAPAVIYIGTDLGVLRSVNGGTDWAVVDDVHLPNAAVSDLELNLQAGVLRAATWGRGVFELAAANGPTIAVDQGSLAFGATCALSGSNRTIDVTNVGTQGLVISGVERIAGALDFTVLSGPAAPLTLGPGGHTAFTVHYEPSTGGASAIIRIASSDPLAPFVDLLATGRRETTAPNISCPAPMVIECAGPSGALTSFSATATDNCAVASVTCPASGSLFPLGTTGVSCTAIDTSGNSSSCTTSVKVVDTALPAINSATATPAVLWPPNHKLIPVAVAVRVTDVCDATIAQSCHIASVTSNEPIAGAGTGHSSPDFVITGRLSVNLRAERSGSGIGRTYTLRIECSDASGNTASRTISVTVAHDQGNK